MYLYILDFAYKVDAGFESLSIFLPLRRANFAIVASHVERCFYLANEFFCVTSNAVVLDFCNLDQTLGIYREITPVWSASMGYLIFLMLSEASCQALWVK